MDGLMSRRRIPPGLRRLPTGVTRARGCTCPIAGRSLRAPPFARSALAALRHPGCACQRGRLSGHVQPRAAEAATAAWRAAAPGVVNLGFTTAGPKAAGAMAGPAAV